MESCVFSYCISDNDIVIKELPIKYSFGKYKVLVDTKTPYIASVNEFQECAIFGYAVNVFTRKSENLANELISMCSDMDDVIEYEKQLGGKYIILYRYKNQYYLLGDATCSVPVLFSTGLNNFMCTSNLNYIVNHHSLTQDEELKEIRDNGDISQAMPYDVTAYREIKQLIPNHYLSLNSEKAIRFVNFKKKQKVLSIEQAVAIVLPMIETISEYYQRNFKVYCPITSGRDSRVVLAFLLSNNNVPTYCYTIKHEEYTENEQDIVVPQKLCTEYAISYEIIEDIVVPEETKVEIDGLLGLNNYSQRTLQIAETVKNNYGDGAIINGDIIGQVGKCSLHRDIPPVLATPGYFRCKLHNYSDNSKQQLALWLKEIEASGEHVNTFDLFSVENRMGRWASQENLIYNSIGQLYLNIFNSRSIIYVWTATERNERKKSLIHTTLIEKKYPKLLNIPFENDENILVKLSKATGILYYISSYLKYYIERIKFKRGLRK